MEKFLLLLLCSACSICNPAFSQNPLVKQWDYRFGGTWYDNLFAFQQTADSGYILGGFSISEVSGDKTQPPQGLFDYWVVKLDSTGIKQWDKRFGGTLYNQLTCLQQTADGGYILGGFSNSGMEGDKSEPNWDTLQYWDPSHATMDYWVVKINSSGEKEWDKRFGGTGDDFLYSLHQTADGGYILGGFSSSPISGDKTQAPWGSVIPTDYWIVKINFLGTIQWDRVFGGTEGEYLRTVQQTSDGGYIIGGGSHSGASGDKTQPSQGAMDYWIIKTNAMGYKTWDKRFGGTEADLFMSLQQTADGGYILGGFSQSGVGGDKTQPTQGGYDFWIVKTDASGVLQWDKDFGGDDHEDAFGTISQTADGGFLLAGTSHSEASGDKTEDALGVEEPWIVKTDSAGNKEWDKSVFIYTHNENGFAMETKDTCYAVATFTNSGIGGYKTQENWDTLHYTGDYWIVKFCEPTRITDVPLIAGNDFSAVIFPNPVVDLLTLEYDARFPSEITIVNYLGEKVYSLTFADTGKTERQINTSQLMDGIYFLIINTGNQKQNLKFIVQR